MGWLGPHPGPVVNVMFVCESLLCRGAKGFRKCLSKIHPDEVALEDAHEFRDKRLEVEDDLGAEPHAVLVEGGPADDVGLEAVVDLGLRDEVEAERFEDRGRGDAVRQQII